MKTRFITYTSGAHLNGQNVALYQREDGTVIARLEIVSSGRVLGSRALPTLADAHEWYASFPGSGLGRLANAMESF